MGVKDIIQQSVARVRQGQGTNEDQAIMHLLKQCKELKEQVHSGIGQTNVPVHESNPWYMQ